MGTKQPRSETGKLYSRIACTNGLRDVDRALYCYLIQHGAHRDNLVIGAPALASALGYSAGAVYASVARLTAHGLITCQRRGRRITSYHVTPAAA